MPDTDPRLLLLHATDNVFVARDQIRAGETILVEGEEIALGFDLKLGHKLARHAIAAGERVLKYGAPIGRATRAIARGEHAHVDNIVSDYTPTYVIAEPKATGAGAS